MQHREAKGSHGKHTQGNNFNNDNDSSDEDTLYKCICGQDFYSQQAMEQHREAKKCDLAQQLVALGGMFLNKFF